jgi:hypothetical protein
MEDGEFVVKLVDTESDQKMLIENVCCIMRMSDDGFYFGAG